MHFVTRLLRCLINVQASRTLSTTNKFSLLKQTTAVHVTRIHSSTDMSNSHLISRLVSSSVSIVDRAGDIIREIMAKGDLGIVEKTGKNDLQTQADRSAQNCIVASLLKQFPGLTVVGEEGEQDLSGVPDDWIVTGGDAAAELKIPEDLKNVDLKDVTVWVDPLDGTQEFTQGLLDHVTVLVGIAVGSRSVAGVIHQPYYNYKEEGATLGRTFYGVVGGGVVGLTPTAPPPDKRIVTTTRSHGTGLVQAALEAIQPDEVMKVGGAGHKVLLLMEGACHAYVFPSPGCKKWDTCAPEAILHAMGGKLTDMKGANYDYHSTVQHLNSEGVLATALAQDHEWYINNIPQDIKEKVKDSFKKKK